MTVTTPPFTKLSKPDATDSGQSKTPGRWVILLSASTGATITSEMAGDGQVVLGVGNSVLNAGPGGIGLGCHSRP